MTNAYFEEGEFFLWIKDKEEQEPPLKLHLEMIREQFRSGKKQALVARDVHTDKKYFLKVLFCSDIEQVFVEKESKVQLYSPFVIRIYGGMLDEKNKRFITVMEYMEEHDLSDLIRQYGLSGDTWKEKLKVRHTIALKFLYGIRHYMSFYDHDPYVHRDLKPENVLASPDGARVKIIDFDWVHLHDSRVTVYMGREQKGTAGYADPKYWSLSVCKKEMDIYSAGLVLYFLYTDRHHFSGNDQITEYMKAEDYAYTLKDMPGIEEEIQRIIAKMIAREECRYHDIEEVIKDMENYLKRQGMSIAFPEMMIEEKKERGIRFSYKVGDVKYSPYIQNYRFVPIEFGTKQERSQNGADSAHILSFYRMNDKIKAVILHEDCQPVKIGSEEEVSEGDQYVYAGTSIQVMQIRKS